MCVCWINEERRQLSFSIGQSLIERSPVSSLLRFSDAALPFRKSFTRLGNSSLLEIPDARRELHSPLTGTFEKSKLFSVYSILLFGWAMSDAPEAKNRTSNSKQQTPSNKNFNFVNFNAIDSAVHWMGVIYTKLPQHISLPSKNANRSQWASKWQNRLGKLKNVQWRRWRCCASALCT